MKERKRLWIPESDKIPVHHIELPPVQIGGYYYVYLIDAETGEVKRELEFPNLITDSGLDFIGQGTSLDTIYTTLAVGTSNTTPTVSDTALGVLSDQRRMMMDKQTQMDLKLLL